MASWRGCRIRAMEMYLLLLRAMYCTVHEVVHCLEGASSSISMPGLGAWRRTVVLCVEGPAKLVAVFGLAGRRQHASNALLVTPWLEFFS